MPSATPGPLVTALQWEPGDSRCPGLSAALGQGLLSVVVLGRGPWLPAWPTVVQCNPPHSRPNLSGTRRIRGLGSVWGRLGGGAQRRVHPRFLGCSAHSGVHSPMRLSGWKCRCLDPNQLWTEGVGEEGWGVLLQDTCQKGPPALVTGEGPGLIGDRWDFLRLFSAPKPFTPLPARPTRPQALAPPTPACRL